jgi:nucleotide-binding universal stress UspA family protein
LKRFRKLLVGLDLSKDGLSVSAGSRAAALQADWLADKTGASITFLHSTHQDLFEDHDRLRLAPSPEGTQALEDLAREYGESGIEVELVYDKERPWMAMARRCVRGDNDLVVVGRHSDLSHDPFPLGSVSRRLLRKCPAPVWVVRPGQDLVHTRVLAATDLTPVGDQAVELGAYVAEAHEAALEVIHVWQTPLSLQMRHGRVSDEAYAAEEKKIVDAAHAHIERVLEPLGYTGDPEVRVVRDAPSRAILAEMERHGVDLLVMGTISRGGIPGMLIGNTAEKLLDRVSCSILTVKPDDFISPVSG